MKPWRQGGKVLLVLRLSRSGDGGQSSSVETGVGGNDAGILNPQFGVGVFTRQFNRPFVRLRPELQKKARSAQECVVNHWANAPCSGIW